MAGIPIFNTTSLTLPQHQHRHSFKPLQLPPLLHISSVTGNLSRRQKRGTALIRRAGPPSTSSYIFAFVFPLSLLAVTVFTSIKIADKLEQDFLEDLAVNEALMQEDEDGDGEVTVQVPAEPEPARSRTRNRPKREA